MQDFEEEGQWCDEKLAVCSATITAKDLRALTSLQQKHKALEDEMVRRHTDSCQDLLLQDKSGHPLADQLKDRVWVVQAKWAMLKEEAAERSLQQSSQAGNLLTQFYYYLLETVFCENWGEEKQLNYLRLTS